jgi:predicted DCC family thiol-disulfide oxidoreductase YuxK
MAVDTMIFDGECGICTASAEWIKARDTADQLAVVPYQTANLETLSPGLTPAMARRSVYFVRSDGRRYKEARAVFETLKRLSGIWRVVGFLLANPICAVLCAPGYRLVARYRKRISIWLGMTACAVPGSAQPK